MPNARRDSLRLSGCVTSTPSGRRIGSRSAERGKGANRNRPECRPSKWQWLTISVPKLPAPDRRVEGALRRRSRGQPAAMVPPCAQPPGGRYDGVLAAAASTSSTVISGVTDPASAPEALTTKENAVALASSGKSQIANTSVSPNA